MQQIFAAALLALSTGLQAQPAPLQVQYRPPGSNFGIFRTQTDMYPGGLDGGDGKKGTSMVPPGLTDPTSGPAKNAPLTWNVASRSVGIFNQTTVTMHLAATGVEFDLAPRTAKTIDLPEGLTALTLTYSINGQQKHIELAPGRSYQLDIDVSKREIVSR